MMMDRNHVTEADAEVGALTALYRKWTGAYPAMMTPLKGDASDRRLYRLGSGTGETHIGVIGPNVAENRAFVSFSRAFRAAGLRTPRIDLVSDDERMYIEEDFGNLLFSDWLAGHGGEDGVDSEALILYERILEELLRFQVDAAHVIDYALCYQGREFDFDAMMTDVRYFRDHVMDAMLSMEYDAAAFMDSAAVFVPFLCEAPRDGFMYRDFQSRNVMLHDGRPCFIDFQSGRKGAPQYDLASMLYDSRTKLSPTQRDELIAHYLHARALRRGMDEKDFRLRFEGFVVIRLMQALGAFGNLGLNKGKVGYLSYIPSRVKALDEILGQTHILDQTSYFRDTLSHSLKALT
jgi:aminoglycoside/choline kinase family phosphotransferase